MRRDSPLIAVLLVVSAFGLAWFALTALASDFIDSGRWLTAAALDSQSAGEKNDPFAVVPDDGAAGSDVQQDVARDALKNAVSVRLGLFITGAALLALLWILWCRVFAPSKGLVSEERSGLAVWLALLLALLVGAAVTGARAAVDVSVAQYMPADARWQLAGIATLTAVLLFWLLTASATPNGLRASVPGAALLPEHGARR